MPDVLYPTYGAPRPLASIKGRTDWRNLDPEMARRCEAIMIACRGALGFGGGARTTAAQTELFRSRHHVDPNGPISWNGQRWTLNRGASSAAPPGKSYHEPTTAAGGALAVDFTGQVSLLADHGYQYGLVEFSQINDEPWHAQPIEIPHARSQYGARFEPLARWVFPGSPEPSQEDDMTAATLWRHPDWTNTFLIGAGPAINVSPMVNDSLVARGVPQVVEAHPQLLQGCLTQAGLSIADLIHA